MTATRNIPTKADLDAILPALQTLADTTPYGFATVTHGDMEGTENPNISIDLPTPGGSSISINAHVAHGPVWKVTVSGTSFRLGTPNEVRTTATILNIAHALAALLTSITTTRQEDEDDTMITECANTDAKQKALAEVMEWARTELMLETLETRNRDSLDIHEIPVWSIRDLIRHAFERGYCEARGQDTPAKP